MSRLIQSKAYGSVVVDDLQILEFPEGLLGFEDYKNFALLDAHKKPFFWLQSLDDTQVAFILIKPSIFRDEYNPGISLEDLSSIGVENLEDCLVFAIVTIPESGPMTANLQGPLYINRKNRQGKQCVSPLDEYRTKHDILEEMAARRE